MSGIDLSGLRMAESTAVVARRPMGPRLLVIGLAALGVALAVTFLWPLLVPARKVRLAAVRVAESGIAKTSAAVTEAVGWVEADPFPIVVRPLVRGRIETLTVLEGETVVANETVLATLASAELEAAKDRAEAMVAERAAAVGAARANHSLAEQRLRQNAEAKLRLVDAATKLAAIDTRLNTAAEQEREGRAAAVGAAAIAKAQERLTEAGTSYPVALERAQAEARAAEASATAAQAKLAGLRREQAAQQSVLELCRELVEDPVDLRGAVAVTTAAVEQAEAALGKAETELEIATRELDWTRVRSAEGGIVLRLESGPGDSVGPGHAGIVALYDPTKLRARIDVPLDSLTGIHVGQKVEITSEAIGNAVVPGVVQRLQHETDLLKNTLQVKIGLVDPPSLLRPETLCRARFLAIAETGSSARTTAVFRVPEAAVRNGMVFVLDPAAGVARGRAVEVVGGAGSDRLVRGELSPTQRVILDAVEDGEAVEEDGR